MKSFRRMITLLAAAAMLAFAGAAPVRAQDTVAFQAELHHFSVPEGTCEDGVCNFVSYGYGTVNIMGSPFVLVTVEFVWDFNTSPCSTLDPLEFTLVGATGSITISGSGSVCPGPNPQLAFPEFFSGVGEITGGTGEFSGITGSVSTQGTIGPRGPVIHMSGTVSY